MARVTVEDCIDKVESPYELVLVAKERATQLNSGIEPSLDRDNDKNTVIALREIASDNIKVSDLTESAVYKLRKHVEQIEETNEEDVEVGDDFENLYKGEISKSGVPILPSKRARKIPDKIQVSKEDLSELQNSPETISSEEVSAEVDSEENEVSIDQLKEVWGISDSLFLQVRPYLVEDHSNLDKRNINELAMNELAKHPYIDWKQAKIISKYMKMHGSFGSMDELHKIHGIDPKLIDTLTYYFEAR